MVGQRGRLLLACALATGCSDSGPTASNVVGPVAGERASTPIYTQVAITTNGGWGDDVSGNETPKSCSKFKVKAGDVSRYFATAKPVDSRAFYHDLDMSQCFAAGSVREGDRPLQWTLDRMGRGQLIEADNRRRLFQCAHCPSPPFEEGAGEVDDDE